MSVKTVLLHQIMGLLLESVFDISILPLSNRSLDSLVLGMGSSHENPGSIHEGARVIKRKIM